MTGQSPQQLSEAAAYRPAVKDPIVNHNNNSLVPQPQVRLSHEQVCFHISFLQFRLILSIVRMKLNALDILLEKR